MQVYACKYKCKYLLAQIYFKKYKEEKCTLVNNDQEIPTNPYNSYFFFMRM
jgi:hypothetical protein